METAKAVDQGKGVLFIYGNYAGDNLNFDMAEEMCQAEGMKTAHVREWDDFASAPKDRITDRRGIAGDVYTIKVAGAACDAGLSLEEVVRIAEKARDNTNTIGLATSPGTLPGNEKATFEIADDEMEFGMGLHGEPGIERTKMMPCSDMVDRMYKELKAEMSLKEGDELAVLVNGLGSTPLLELNLVNYELYKRMHKDGLKVYDTEIKTYCTCMEMGGFSITFMKLDDELKKYYDAPCFSPYYAKGAVNGEDLTAVEEEDEIEFDETDIQPAKIVRSKAGTLSELNAEDTRNMLLYIADKVIAKKPYLTEVDSAIGDGDHGIGMAGGMQKAKKKLLNMEGEENVYQLFETAGQAMLMSMGGASGVIFGSLYLAGAKGVEPKTSIVADDLAKMEKKSLAAIQERGGAQVGDKTMVDALAPAVEALEANTDQSLLEALIAAEEAAREHVLLMEAFAFRHAPLVQKVKELIDAGAIGKVKYVESHLTDVMDDMSNIRMNNRLGGGSFYDMACYNISTISYLLGGKNPIQIKALAEMNVAQGVDASNVAIMLYEDGTQAMSYSSLNSYARGYYVVVGEIGRIEVPCNYNCRNIQKFTVTTEGVVDNVEILDEKKTEYTVNCPDNYMLEIEQFGRCILNGEKPLVSKEETVLNAEILDRMFESAK